LIKPFLSLDVKSATKGYGYSDDPYTNPDEIRSFAYDPSGMYMAAGTAGGIVALYDVRSSRPLHIMEHKHGMPIHTVKFHPYSGCIFSGDEKLVKIWRYKASTDIMTDEKTSAMGSVVVNVEGTGKLSHFIVAGDENDPTGNKSGVLLCATDQPKMESFYIPSVGLAPKWCSFLENITEELEERDLVKSDGKGSESFLQDGQESAFENYKFVSHEEVEKLGISNLVGTPLLRGYMHGFFMDIQLYNRVRAVANPFEYEEYRKKKLKERMDAKRASRIAPKGAKKTKTSVNPDFANRLEDKVDNSKAGKVAKQVLSDNRFGGLFTNPDFHIDEKDHNFKLRNPSGIAASKKRKNDLDSDDEDSDDDNEDEQSEQDDKPVGFSRVEEEEDDDDESDDGDSDGDSDEDGFAGAKVRGEMYEEMKSQKKAKKVKLAKKPKKTSKTVMYEADDFGSAANDAVGIGLGDASADSRVRRRHEELNMTLEERLSAKANESKFVGEATTVITKGEGASREFSYTPKDARKKNNTAEDKEDPAKGKRRERRGVKDLGFRAPYKKN
jgi:ribosome biogenesis protein ENP2